MVGYIPKTLEIFSETSGNSSERYDELRNG